MRKARQEPQTFGFAELRAGQTKVVIIPALGGKIASLVLGGREWLWRNDVIPYATPVDGASYVETGDTGGEEDDDDNLPNTGGPDMMWLLLGGALVAAGAGGVAYGRRRAQGVPA